MQADLKPEMGERLGKLLPRLASDHPGEVVATVAALRRTLDRAGLDLHDLAARLTAPQSNAGPWPRDAYGDASSATALREMADWLDRYALHLLTDKQRGFVENVRLLLLRGRTLTPRQAAYLADLHALNGGGHD